MYRLVKAALISTCLAISMTAWKATAHESVSGEVSVSHPWALPANAGENTKLFMVIENEEPGRITLMSVETPVARSTQFHFQADSETVLSLSSRTIGSEEKLNVATHHMWFELSDLRRDLVAGTQFPATLTLADGRTIDLTVAVGRSADSEKTGG